MESSHNYRRHIYNGVEFHAVQLVWSYFLLQNKSLLPKIYLISLKGWSGHNLPSRSFENTSWCWSGLQDWTSSCVCSKSALTSWQSLLRSVNTYITWNLLFFYSKTSLETEKPFTLRSNLFEFISPSIMQPIVLLRSSTITRQEDLTEKKTTNRVFIHSLCKD